MELLASIGNPPWLCDVGSGGDGLPESVAIDGVECDPFGRTFRIVRQGSLHVLRAEWVDAREDLCDFIPEGRYPVDFEMAHWFTSTYPESPCVSRLTLQSASAEARCILRNISYPVVRGSVAEVREIPRTDLIPLLPASFRLDLPEASRFRALDHAQP